MTHKGQENKIVKNDSANKGKKEKASMLPHSNNHKGHIICSIKSNGEVKINEG